MGYPFKVKVTINEGEAPGRVTPEALGAYLKERGWKISAVSGTADIWSRGESTVQAPRKSDYADYSARVRDVVNVCAMMEDRQQADVLVDMLGVPFKPSLPDTLKPAWDRLSELLENPAADNDPIRDAAIDLISAIQGTFDPDTFGMDFDTVDEFPGECPGCGIKIAMATNRTVEPNIVRLSCPAKCGWGPHDYKFLEKQLGHQQMFRRIH